MLGVSVNTFRVWATRARTARTGIAASMPSPVATLHGQVYRSEEIEDFGRLIALNARSPRSAQRGLGAYYTPSIAANLMVQWAVRDATNTLIEPSVGDGEFAIAAQRYAHGMGWGTLDVYACELDPETAARAASVGAIAPSRMRVGDFLSCHDLPSADAVIGNPPFVRVRELSAPLRRSALDAASSTLPRPMDASGSVWMPFVSKSLTHLKPGGRLALVLPLDFTYVKYARQLWLLLGAEFKKLSIIRFRERVFPDIMQNVLILLADGRGGSTDEVEVVSYDRIADVPDAGFGAGVSVPIEQVVSGQKVFQYALLPKETREVLQSLQAESAPAKGRIKFNIGYVSGNKQFFHPSPDTVQKFGIPQSSLQPTIQTSRQLTGSGLRTSSMTRSAELWSPIGELTSGEADYVSYGEANGVDMAYKCRIRKPWYRVPGVRNPQILMTTFSDRPRIHLNDAEWVASNSILCGYIQTRESAESIIESWYTPLTLLSVELNIHSLGGGVMIAVPGEADAVQLIDAKVTRPVDQSAIDAALRSNDATAAYSVGSASIEALVGVDGVDALWRGAAELERWRKAQV